MSALARVRGLVALVSDGVEHGSRAVERVQHETMARPMVILEAIPPLAAPARMVHVAHLLVVSAVHANIRLVNRLVGVAVGTTLDVGEVVHSVVTRLAAAEASAPGDDVTPPPGTPNAS